jgi:hypothetical protein
LSIFYIPLFKKKEEPLKKVLPEKMVGTRNILEINWDDVTL